MNNNDIISIVWPFRKYMRRFQSLIFTSFLFNVSAVDAPISEFSYQTVLGMRKLGKLVWRQDTTGDKQFYDVDLLYSIVLRIPRTDGRTNLKTEFDTA